MFTWEEIKVMVILIVVVGLVVCTIIKLAQGSHKRMEKWVRKEHLRISEFKQVNEFMFEYRKKIGFQK